MLWRLAHARSIIHAHYPSTHAFVRTVLKTPTAKRTFLLSAAGMGGARKCGVSFRGLATSAALVEEDFKGGGSRRPRKRSASQQLAEAPPRKPFHIDMEDEPKSANAAPTGKSHLSKSRFDQFKLSPFSLKAIHDVLGYDNMTLVQETSLPVILQGKDVLAKAKTGTGKTIAFLLPTIEKIIQVQDTKSVHPNPIRALIVCPTRELAMQAAKEATTLLKFHTQLGAQTAIGGNSSTAEAKKIKLQPCQILVGTPGRLLDHIQNARGFTDQLQGLKVLILDEADTLLDMGFRQNLTDIIRAVPKSRQTLLFSATIPKEVHGISKLALKEDHKFIDIVGEDTETHAMVKQRYLIVQQENQLSTVYTLLKNHIAAEPNYKVLAFCTTANITACMAAVFQKLGFNIREIHSRKTQTYRTRVSDEFRKSKGGLIMFTSDVSARGIDYPDVTLVLQIGIPAGREQYIHRLGRTGRAGKEGEGVLLLMPWEESFVKKLADLSLERMEPPKSSQLAHQVKQCLMDIDDSVKTRAYQSWLGYYTTAKSLPVDKWTVVEHSKKYSASLGYQRPPSLQKQTIKKMGLAGVLD